jgi:hypothetical protein
MQLLGFRDTVYGSPRKEEKKKKKTSNENSPKEIPAYFHRQYGVIISFKKKDTSPSKT